MLHYKHISFWSYSCADHLQTVAQEPQASARTSAVAPAACNRASAPWFKLGSNESLRWGQTGDAGQDRGRLFVDLRSQQWEAGSTRGRCRTKSGQEQVDLASKTVQKWNTAIKLPQKLEFLWVLCEGNSAFEVFLVESLEIREIDQIQRWTLLIPTGKWHYCSIQKKLQNRNKLYCRHK